MKKILGIVAAASALVAAPAHATNGMRMIGFGPVQNSMGGAAVAAPLDSATVVSNPAGLAALGQRVDLAAQAFMPTVKYSIKNPGPTLDGTSDRPTDFLPTLGGVYRVQDEITLGFAALGTAGMGVDYKAAPGTGGDRLMSSYLNGRVAPAVAYKVGDQVSVGFALNLMYAQMAFEQGGAPKFSASSFGYGATVGLTVKANDMITLGAAYETKSSFSDFEDTIMGTKYAIDFDQPAVATVGVAVRPATGFLLAVDGQWINWADVMGSNQPQYTKPVGAGSFDMKWSDQFVAKIGAQYQLPSVQALKVRAGYNYGANPLNAGNPGPNMMFPAVAVHHFTLGGGYDAGKYTVNLAAVYSPEASVKGDMGPGMQLESKMSQLAFELGGTYRF